MFNPHDTAERPKAQGLTDLERELLASLKSHVMISAWALEALREASPEQYDAVIRLTAETIPGLPGATAFAAIAKAEGR